MKNRISDTKNGIYGARAPRNASVKRPVSCGFMKRKKRGHDSHQKHKKVKC